MESPEEGIYMTEIDSSYGKGLTAEPRLKTTSSAVDLSSTLRGTPFSAPHAPLQQSKREQYMQLFWENKHTTVTLCLVFWAFGMCVAFLGPTLLDLGCKTSTVLSTMSWVFFCQSLFVLVGSACGGLLLRRFSAEVLLLVGTVMMTLTMALIPFCNALWALAIVLAVMGLFMGTIDTVANVSMICLYGKDVSPFLQAIHFFYGVGAFVSPMIAQPFLLNEDCSSFISNVSDPVFDDVSLEGGDNDTDPASTLAEAQQMTHIDYAFWIMSLVMIPVVMMSFSLVGRKHCLRMLGAGGAYEEDTADDKQKEYQSMGEGRMDEEKGQVVLTSSQIALVTILAAILMFLYDGLQAAYGGYIYSYAVKGPTRFHKTDAAYLNALFWGMFATGRLVSIALATKLSPSFMLFCNIIGCTFGLLLMLALRYSHVMLIIGTCMLGIFMSSVFPTTLSLTEQYIHVTPTTTSFLVFGAAVGEMTMPVIVGHEFFMNGPISFLVTGLVLCFISIIAYMSLWLAGFTVLKPDSTPGIMVWFSKCMPGTLQKVEGENSSLVNQKVQYYSRMQASPAGSPDDQDGTVGFVKKEWETPH